MSKHGKKMLPNGRSRGEAKHVRHYRYQLDCSAWRALSMTARCLEMELKALHNGSNNGDIFLSVREAAKRLGIAPSTAARAFDELEEKGFIRPKHKGDFRHKIRHATSWILTEIEYAGQLPTKDFMRWQPPEKEKSRYSNSVPSVRTLNTPVSNSVPRTGVTVCEMSTDLRKNTP